jgi:hypothetical protein
MVVGFTTTYAISAMPTKVVSSQDTHFGEMMMLSPLVGLFDGV